MVEIEKAKKRLEFEKEELQSALEVECTLKAEKNRHSCLLKQIAIAETSVQNRQWKQMSQFPVLEVHRRRDSVNS